MTATVSYLPILLTREPYAMDPIDTRTPHDGSHLSVRRLGMLQEGVPRCQCRSESAPSYSTAAHGPKCPSRTLARDVQPFRRAAVLGEGKECKGVGIRVCVTSASDLAFWFGPDPSERGVAVGCGYALGVFSPSTRFPFLLHARCVMCVSPHSHGVTREKGHFFF